MTDTPSPRTDRAEPDEPRSSCSREPKGQAKAKRTCIYSWRKAAKSAQPTFGSIIQRQLSEPVCAAAARFAA